MKERGMMLRLQKLILHSLTGRIILAVLAVAYLAYMVAFTHSALTSLSTPSGTIVEHATDTSSTVILAHWTAASMQNATAVDPVVGQDFTLTQASSDTTQDQATQQQGQLPRDSSLAFPISTVGKVFFTNSSGQNYVCSGTAVASLNHNVVDTAGHCLYLYGSWVSNVIFCPLYENGSTPYGCWAARDLEVPADWIDAKPNDYHHDFGMAIVAPNGEGNLTDVVGGAGWAYNLPVKQPFYAYGYPAAYPFDGQRRQSCENASGTLSKHGDGTVVSIPCGMTGGSSGGPWFIQSNGHWYLDGHNDFISRLQPGHMFSPYYDDTWNALYNKAQRT
jgi:V8-like Glu-specific endopeptidase